MATNTIWFRPLSTQPYEINEAAKWYVSIGTFSNLESAVTYLIDAEHNRPTRFRDLITNWKEKTKFRVGYLKAAPKMMNLHYPGQQYGDDSHLYNYSKK